MAAVLAEATHQMSETQSVSGSSNLGFVDGNLLRFRLDTQPILDAVENFLRGERPNIVIENGEMLAKKEKCGEALLNDMGVQAILNRLNLILNSSVAQGNWTGEQYRQNISQIRRSIAKDLMINRYKYKLEITNYMMICDSIMSCLKGFLSRLIDNEERKSYGFQKEWSHERVDGRQNSIGWRKD